MKHFTFRTKNLIIALTATFLFSAYSAKSVNPIHVSGKYIIGSDGDTLTFYGVNYPVYNWGYTTSENYFPEIAKTHSNAVRIPWYAYSSLPAYSSISYLDSAISRALRYKMIPIIELHNETSQPADSLVNLLPYYKQAAFLNLEIKYRRDLIINIANEVGYYAWDQSSTADLDDYRNSYINTVDSLRKYGIKVPLMIDAPDGGSNADVIDSEGAKILKADPLKNIIFSIHGYWESFANNDSATMAQKVASLYNTGLAVHFGEVSTEQDGNTACQYTLNYKALLNILEKYKIGWTAWVWIGDNCSGRQMTTNGAYSSLTSFGDYITGITKNAKTALDLTGTATGLDAIENNNLEVDVYPNPFSSVTNIRYQLDKPADVYMEITDMNGKTIAVIKKSKSESGTYTEQFNASTFQCRQGIYFLKFVAGNTVIMKKLEVL